MSDQFDEAEVVESLAREGAIAVAREAAKHPEIPPTGRCYYCADPVAGQLRFCGPECRDGHAFEQRQRNRARR